MNRKTFLASLAGLLVVPKMIKTEEKSVFNLTRLKKRRDELRKYPLTPDQCLTPQQVYEFYMKTGHLIKQDCKII